MFVEINLDKLQNLPLILNTVGQSFPQKNTHRPNGINNHEFIWVSEGEGEFIVDNDRFTLKCGEGIFLRSGIPISYHGNPFSTSWITFFTDPKLFDYLGVGNYLKFSVPAFLDSERDALDLFCSSSSSTPLSRSASTYSLISQIFSAILNTSEALEERVRNFLETHYSEPLTLDMIAEHVGSDRFSLCHYYKKNCPLSVIEELNNIRIKKAKRLLRYTDIPVAQIGTMCGFESASYFAKIFKEQYGQSPSKYRNEHNT